MGDWHTRPELVQARRVVIEFFKRVGLNADKRSAKTAQSATQPTFNQEPRHA